jgi:pimeloyl-ACP methyl ester carboxylesterase
VEPLAPRDQEPDVWEDYVTAYENGRFAESTRYVRSYPEQLPVLSGLLPAITIPVRAFGSTGDPMVPVSNARYLADRIPGSELTVLTAGHFPWEEIPDQFAAMVADWATRSLNGAVRYGHGPDGPESRHGTVTEPTRVAWRRHPGMRLAD